MMDVQEAIEWFQKRIRQNTMAISPMMEGKEPEYYEAYKTAIAAMEELQQYHQVGPTPEQLRLIDDFYRERCEEIHKLTKKKWHYVEKEGNPKEPGTYWVTLIYPEWKDGKQTGRKLAEVSTRYYADLFKELELRGWIMDGEPEAGLAWTEEIGSCSGERVHAWMPIEELEAAELPEGVVML
jgi:hypothetical protein